MFNAFTVENGIICQNLWNLTYLFEKSPTNPNQRDDLVTNEKASQNYSEEGGFAFLVKIAIHSC